MALSEKFLEVANLVEIAENGQEAINALYNFKDKNDSTPILKQIQEIIDKMANIVEQIQDETQDFLNRVGASSKQQFRKDVQDFYKRKGVAHFYGPAVLKIIEGYQLAGDKNTQDLNQFIVKYLEEASNQTIKAVIEHNKIKIVENVGSYAVDELISGLITGMRDVGYARIRSPKAIESIRKAEELIVNDLSEGTRKGILDMLRHPNKKILFVNDKSIDVQELYNNIKKVDVSFDKKDTELKIGFFWGQYMSTTEGYKNTDYFKQKSKNSKGEREWKKDKREELEQFNRELIARIAKVLRVKGAEEVMLKMASQDPMLFVVGNAGTKIIGILGEILAAVAISKLLNNKYEPTTTLDWVANIRNQGRELSVDLILKEIGIDSGIQVKASSKDIKENLDISFGKGNFLDTFNTKGKLLNSNIFNKMGVDEIIDQLHTQNSNIDILSIQEPLESHAFNVPYANAGTNRVRRVSTDFIYENDSSAQSNFRSFVGIYEKMADIANKIYLFFDVFMPDFLYMSKGADAENLLATLDNQLQNTNVQGNIVYFFGTDVQFAEDMLSIFIQDLNQLKELYEQDRILSQQMHFTLSTEFGKTHKDDLFMKDIVDYLNSNGKINLTSYKSILISSWKPFV